MPQHAGFDEVWIYIPQFSRKQFILTAVTGLISFQDGLLCMYPIFAAFSPLYNCNTQIIDSNVCLGFQNISELSSSSSMMSHNQCKEFKDNNGTCEYSSCNDWNYSHPLLNNTLVTEFDLICDKTWIRDTIFSVGNIGLAVGSFLGGPMTEIYGRKFTMFSITLLTVLFLAVQAFTKVVV